MISPSAQKLTAARKAAGYPSARAAALAMDVPTATYGQHERGNRKFTADQLETYFAFFTANPYKADD
jgi:hypothetical protein